jgi:hypothetical protein
MKKSYFFTTVSLFFIHFFCTAQNSIIVGPQNDCSLFNNNIKTSKSKFNVEGINNIRIETFQHRTYDKSRIYDENGNILWEWKGESYNDAWYKKEHFLSINNRFIEIEFYQGYGAPFCQGYIKIDKIVNNKVPSVVNEKRRPPVVVNEKRRPPVVVKSLSWNSTLEVYNNQNLEKYNSNQNNSNKVESIKTSDGAIEFQVVSRPYEVGNLQVAQYDISEQMDWYTAKDLCSKLGQGWRLPTRDELTSLCQSEKEIGLTDIYWTSTEENNDEAWTVQRRLLVGEANLYNKYSKRYSNSVRVVRDLSYKQSRLDIIKSQIIGNPIEIGNLIVAQYDYPQNLDWDSANIACQSLGDGWRLPTKDELNTLYKNKTKIGGFFKQSYWSSTEYNSQQAWLHDFKHGIQYGSNGFGFKTKNILYVRAVRTKVKAELIVGKPINSQSVGQSKSQTDVIKLSPTQVCNWKPSRPKLSFILVDNRRMCDCCNARNARHSEKTTTVIQSEKNLEEITYLHELLRKHLKDSNADENHKDGDYEKFYEFAYKTYGKTSETKGNIYVSIWSVSISNAFGVDMLKNAQKRIKRFEIYSNYCSNLCQNLCY